ncbi:MAG: hypothetical protein QNJ53_27490 [Pleurocapsa sp. MO_192.B19]|nr:hypothetical protein [Pleurocapsa sp. MO_192.B19]
MVKFQLQAIDTNEQPLTDANLKVRILTPTKTPWFTADFPLVEGTELLNLGAIAPQGNLEFEQVLPIRGNYAMEVGVNPQITGAFEVFDVEKLAKSSFVSPKSAENLELSQLNSWQTAIKAMSSTSSAIARSNLWQ